MESATFAEFYRGDLQSLYALWVVPLLFLVVLLFGSRGRAEARSTDRDARFLWRYCVVFALETIVDPLATGPLIRALGAQDVALGTAITVLFVLLGDFRVLLLIFRLSDRTADLAAALRSAAAWTLIVPLSAYAADSLLAASVHHLPADTIWLIYELAFLALALWLRRRGIPRWLARGDVERRRALQAVAGYAATYYGLWATADVLIQWCGLDAGWLLRIVPNQLYYALYLPFVYVRLAPRRADSTRQSTQASR